MKYRTAKAMGGPREPRVERARRQETRACLPASHLTDARLLALTSTRLLNRSLRLSYLSSTSYLLPPFLSRTLLKS